MEPQHNDLEELRRQWQSMKLNSDRLEHTNVRLRRQLAGERADSKQKRLVLRYRIMGLVGFVILPFMALILYRELDAPLWLAWLYGVIGVILSILNLGFSIYVASTDYITCPTAEALTHAHNVVLWQARLLMVGIILAVGVLAPMVMYFVSMDNAAVLIGAFVGLLVGCAIGYIRYNSCRRLARRMIADLEIED